MSVESFVHESGTSEQVGHARSGEGGLALPYNGHGVGLDVRLLHLPLGRDHKRVMLRGYYKWVLQWSQNHPAI